MPQFSTVEEYTDYINSDEFDVSTHGQTNVFWSGNSWVNPDTGERESLNKLTAEGHYSSEGLADQDGMTLEQTAGGQWLQSQNLYEPDSSFSRDDADAIWHTASQKYADNSSGDVVAVMHDADPNRTFGAVELPALLQNEQVNSINGVSRTELASVYDADQSEDKSQATNEIFGKIDNTYYSAKEAETAQEAPSGSGIPVDPQAYDIPELVNNESVSSINSVSREELKNTYDQNPDQAQGREAVMEEISQPSINDGANAAPETAVSPAATAAAQPSAEPEQPSDAQNSALAALRSAQSSSDDGPSQPTASEQAAATIDQAKTQPETTPSSSPEPSSTPSGPPPDDFGP